MVLKPILFNTPMVRAILEGRKTQTRRVCKVSSRTMNIENKDCGSVVYPSSNFWGICADFYDKKGFWRGAVKPKYQPGDILYVRETWGDYRESSEDGEGYYTLYRADYPEGAKTYKAGEDEFGKEIICDLPKWHPSIHMPKEYARIFLRITHVRVERLQEAEEYDIEEEGYMGCPSEHTVYFPEGGAEPCFNIEGECPYHGWYCGHSLAEGFGRDIWDETIKPADRHRYGWYANPWVWVYTFERIPYEEVMK